MSARAMKQVWDSPWKGQPAMWAVHVAVADTVNNAHGYRFWMSRQHLADKAGVSLRTVAQWMRQAVEVGVMELLVDNSLVGRPNRYQFVLDPAYNDHPETAVEDDEQTRLVPEEGVQSSQGGVQPLHGGVQSLHSEQETNIKKNLKNPTGSSYVNDVVAETTGEEGLTKNARAVLNAWISATGRDAARCKLNAKRVAAVRARLNEGYTVDDLISAVRGISQSRWHQGDNPEGKRYDDMLVAIRDGERVEKFRDLWEQGGEKGPTSAVDRLLMGLTEAGEIELVFGQRELQQ